ncbi:MAG TPA: DUF2141 domain-containing protein [Micropepsaceae bacterium]|nr:DUF2141 domain-containing protein [Micropepsaceae bacterium]
MAVMTNGRAAQTPLAVSLHVTVDGITPAGGNLIIGVYDEATFTLAQDVPLFVQTVANAHGSATVVFDRLPPGTYALKAVQDVNRDGRASPGEPVAISNGATPANFDAAGITLQPGETTAVLHLR